MSYSKKEEDLVRCRMWTRLLGSEYHLANKNKKKHMKENYCKLKDLQSHQVVPEPCDYCCVEAGAVNKPLGELKQYSLDDTIELDFILADLEKPVCKKKGKRKANTMYTFDDYEGISDESKKRSYLSTRLYNTQYAKEAELRKTFHISDDDPPYTMEDFIARLNAGKYVLPEHVQKEIKDYSWYRIISSYIRWRDPAVEADTDGYEAATKELFKALTAAQDVAAVSDPADGLKALQALEAWQPTTAAN